SPTATPTGSTTHPVEISAQCQVSYHRRLQANQAQLVSDRRCRHPPQAMRPDHSCLYRELHRVVHPFSPDYLAYLATLPSREGSPTALLREALGAIRCEPERRFSHRDRYQCPEQSACRVTAGW